MSKSNHDQSQQQIAAPPAQSVIGKNLRIKGEISGAEPLHIAGSIIGTISFAGNLVTVGNDGNVMAQITAGNLSVIGKVRGNVQAEDRVEIRAGGSLLGEVIAQRIRVEDGALLQGRVNLEGETKEAVQTAAEA